MTGEIDRYKQYASECLRLAQETADDVQKAQLLEMAEAWQRLARIISKRQQPYDRQRLSRLTHMRTPPGSQTNESQLTCGEPRCGFLSASTFAARLLRF